MMPMPNEKLPVRGGVSFKEKRYLAIMVLMLVLLGSIALKPFFDRRALDKELASRPVVPPGTEVVSDDLGLAGDEVKAGVRSGTAAPPQRAADLAAYTPGMVLGDPALWSTEDPVVAPAAFNQAVACMADMLPEEIARAASPDPFPAAAGLPAARGRVFRIIGRLVEMEFTDVPLDQVVAIKLPLAHYMYTGVIEEQGTGQRVAVRGIDICEEYIIDRDVTCDALLAGTVMTGPEAAPVPMPLAVFKYLRRVAYDPLAGIKAYVPGLRLGDPEVWAMADDQLTDVIEQEPYYHALELLTAISDADLEACVDPELTYPDLMRYTLRAEQNRGKVYRLEGQLLLVEERRIDPLREVTAKVPNSPFVYIGQVMETASRKPFTFRALSIPKALHAGDQVEITGVYVKIYTYPNRQGGGHMTRTPLVMARMVVRFEQGPTWMPIAGGMAALLLILLGGLALFERRKQAESEARIEIILKNRVRRAREAAVREKAGPAPSSATPPGGPDPGGPPADNAPRP
ncbi:MAG: hypothetical protein ABIF71_13005 [Planctomycetota bacterium]